MKQNIFQLSCNELATPRSILTQRFWGLQLPLNMLCIKVHPNNVYPTQANRYTWCSDSIILKTRTVLCVFLSNHSNKTSAWDINFFSTHQLSAYQYVPCHVLNRLVYHCQNFRCPGCFVSPQRPNTHLQAGKHTVASDSGPNAILYFDPSFFLIFPI